MGGQTPAVFPKPDNLSVVIHPSESFHIQAQGKTRLFPSSVYPPGSNTRLRLARHSSRCFLTKYLLLGSRDEEVGTHKNRHTDRSHRVGRAPHSVLLRLEDPWAAACEWVWTGIDLPGIGLSSLGFQRPQTPPPSQPHKCHNCKAEGAPPPALRPAPLIHFSTPPHDF